MVTYVGAHEIGHQWWAHQVIGADQQGGAMLSETFAQYSALMVMKHTYGESQIRKFLKFELDSYLRSRGGDPIDEQPLYKVENQPYVYYRKGSLVMYRLQSELGEEVVNRALRKLIAEHAFKGAPYPITTDFLTALRAEAPADKQALITDLFEKITLYDLKTKGDVVRKRADGKFDVTVTVDAQKKYADGKGKETERAAERDHGHRPVHGWSRARRASPPRTSWPSSAGRSARACRPSPSRWPRRRSSRASIPTTRSSTATATTTRPRSRVSEAPAALKMDAAALNAFLRRPFLRRSGTMPRWPRSSRGGCW
jgi:aminopeptidase N